MLNGCIYMATVAIKGLSHSFTATLTDSILGLRLGLDLLC